MPSFTTQVPNLVQTGPIVQLHVLYPSPLEHKLSKEEKEKLNPVQIQAMIDTGATVTVIKEEVIKQLNLNPVGTKLIHTPSSTNVLCYEYQVRLLFPNNVHIEVIAIAAPLENQHIQCLVGRDILSQGVLVYTGYMNLFTLSF